MALPGVRGGHDVVARPLREVQPGAGAMSNVFQMEPWVTKDQVARHLAVSERWVELRMRDAAFPHKKCGRSVRFRLSDVERWLEERG